MVSCPGTSSSIIKLYRKSWHFRPWLHYGWALPRKTNFPRNFRKRPAYQNCNCLGCTHQVGMAWWNLAGNIKGNKLSNGASTIAETTYAKFDKGRIVRWRSWFTIENVQVQSRRTIICTAMHESPLFQECSSEPQESCRKSGIKFYGED